MSQLTQTKHGDQNLHFNNMFFKKIRINSYLMWYVTQATASLFSQHIHTVGWLTEEHHDCKDPASATQKCCPLVELGGSGLKRKNWVRRPKTDHINTYSNYGIFDSEGSCRIKQWRVQWDIFLAAVNALVPFIALTLSVGCQEGIQFAKRHASFIPFLFWNKWRKKSRRGTG